MCQLGVPRKKSVEHHSTEFEHSVLSIELSLTLSLKGFCKIICAHGQPTYFKLKAPLAVCVSLGAWKDCISLEEKMNFFTKTDQYKGFKTLHQEELVFF